MNRFASRSARGSSLVELLLVLAVLGLLATMLAPIETGLLKALRRDASAGDPTLDRVRAAAAFTEDVRRARSWRRIPGGGLRLEHPAGGRIEWHTSAGTLRRVEPSGGERVYPRLTRLTIRDRSVRDLVEVELVDTRGRVAVLAVGLRFAEKATGGHR